MNISEGDISIQSIALAIENYNKIIFQTKIFHHFIVLRKKIISDTKNFYEGRKTLATFIPKSTGLSAQKYE